MAGSKLAKPRNLVDAERAAFRERYDGPDRIIEKAVCDVVAHEKLDAILTALGGQPTSEYNEVSSVASSVETSIVSFTAQVGVVTSLQSISFGGTNISEYRVKINGVVVDKYYTQHGSGLQGVISFGNQLLTAGDVVTLTTEHNRPMTGNFHGRIQVVET